MSTDSTPEAPAVTPAGLGLPDQPLTAGPQDPPAAHVRAKVDAQLRALLRYEPGTRSGADPEDLHQMRVAVRRMRSVLKLSGELLGPDAERVRVELGWLGGALGEVRDHDVLIEHLHEVVRDFEEQDQPAAAELIAVFTGQRGRSKGKLTRALNSKRYRQLRLDTAALATGSAAGQEAARAEDTAKEKGAALVGTLRKPYRRFRKAVRALPADPPDDELHELRIHCKRLRYAAELARPAAGKKGTKRIKTLVGATKELQTVLGEHQDAVVAAERVRALVDEHEGGVAFVAGRIVERELARRAEARQAWRGIVKDIDSAARALL
ncbi:CHAD domain-containing protein [Amycolatopsis cihanbeyliensis]|uniref:CHAD domain-containing protein n=1 Tax=Amycolatopsis cihanbeyliensis TaxID=1128664 RepID=A0A542DNX9_AMYCI|nr:CHAD domain-containing protein [Amycolatopsis cihanbeyliensis]TQJ04813.1 CHAD domain-containing protein [Amycolatopsis cihanbeyliensis]